MGKDRGGGGGIGGRLRSARDETFAVPQPTLHGGRLRWSEALQASPDLPATALPQDRGPVARV